MEIEAAAARLSRQEQEELFRHLAQRLNGVSSEKPLAPTINWEGKDGFPVIRGHGVITTEMVKNIEAQCF